MSDEAINLSRHGATKQGNGLVLPAFIEMPDGTYWRIEDVKADPKQRDAFVKRLRRELWQLNHLRKAKVRLIDWLLQEEEDKPAA